MANNDDDNDENDNDNIIRLPPERYRLDSENLRHELTDLAEALEVAQADDAERHALEQELLTTRNFLRELIAHLLELRRRRLLTDEVLDAVVDGHTLRELLA